MLIFLILSVSFLFSRFFIYFNLPKVLSPIFFGIFIGYYRDYLGLINLDSLEFLSELGIIMLLFYIGLELNLNNVKKQGNQTIFVAVFGFIFTFILGFIFSHMIMSYSIKVSFVIASVLSVTAESIVIVILEQAKLLKSKIGEVIIGAGLLDDIFGLFFLAIISIMVADNYSLISMLPLFLGVLVVFIGYFFIKKISYFIDKVFMQDSLKLYDIFTISIIFLLFFALFSSLIGLDFSLGAILSGILLNFSLSREGKKGVLEEHQINLFIKNMTFGFLSYFLFFWIGFNIDLTQFLQNPVLGFIFAIIAFNGKFFAGLFSSYITKNNFFTGSLIGVGMTTKGGVELIILEIARKSGLINVQIFSALVLMSLILTIFSPIIFNIIVKKYNKGLLLKTGNI